MDVFAGSGTTSTTLTYLLYEISKPGHQHTQQLLREENWQLRPNDVLGVRKSIYINAVVRETVRLHPTIISTLPRVLTDTLALDQYRMPVGTYIGMQNLVHHRDRNPIYSYQITG